MNNSLDNLTDRELEDEITRVIEMLPQCEGWILKRPRNWAERLVGFKSKVVYSPDGWDHSCDGGITWVSRNIHNSALERRMLEGDMCVAYAQHFADLVKRVYYHECDITTVNRVRAQAAYQTLIDLLPE